MTPGILAQRTCFQIKYLFLLHVQHKVYSVGLHGILWFFVYICGERETFKLNNVKLCLY